MSHSSGVSQGEGGRVPSRLSLPGPPLGGGGAVSPEGVGLSSECGPDSSASPWSEATDNHTRSHSHSHSHTHVSFLDTSGKYDGVSLWVFSNILVLKTSDSHLWVSSASLRRGHLVMPGDIVVTTLGGYYCYPGVGARGAADPPRCPGRPPAEAQQPPGSAVLS